MPIRVSSGRQLTNARVGELSVQTTSVRPISDVDWREYLDNCMDEFEESGAMAKAVLQYSLVTSPTARQRKELDAVQTRMGPFGTIRRVAIVTDSAMARGAMAVIVWLFRLEVPIKGFAGHEVDRALRWLAEVANFSHEEALGVLDESAQIVGYKPVAEPARKIL
jgi:hypothetical protein